MNLWAERLSPFFQLPKTTQNNDKIFITQELMKELREDNDVLNKCSHLAVTQPVAKKQLILMTDALFWAATYAVLTQEDPYQKFTSTRRTYGLITYMVLKHLHTQK